MMNPSSPLLYVADPNRIANIQPLLPEMDQLYLAYAKEHQLPGCAYGLVVDDQLIHAKGIGYSDVEKRVSFTPASFFRIASITKSFTALAILKLRDQNRLKLDDPVEDYVPELGNQKLTAADAPLITIRDLLTHTAGFPDDNYFADRKLDRSKLELMEMIKKGLSLAHVTGITYEYSNLGYTLLGCIIEQITGHSYQHFISNLLAPVLNAQELRWDCAPVPVEQVVQGYSCKNDTWQQEIVLKNGIFGAMGGLWTSIQGFSRYMAFHLSAWPPRDERDNGIIKRSSLREMQRLWSFKESTVQTKVQTDDKSQSQVMTTGYGYGLSWSSDTQKRIFVGHSGGLPGFGSNWSILPEYGIGLVSFANLTYAPMDKINLQILTKIVDEANLQPRCPSPSALLIQRQASVIKLLIEEVDLKKIEGFTANFFLDFPSDKIKQDKKSIKDKLGELITVNELKVENSLAAHFILKGKKQQATITFTLTPENPPLIQSYNIKF